jgi:hypothetical protein
MTDYLAEPHRGEVVAWLKSKGFIEDRGLLCISWSCRSGYDFTDLEFYPLARRADDLGWDAIIGHHASGENPRLVIGRCETLADVQMVYNTIRLINGYKEPEAEIDGGLSATVGKCIE